MFAGTSTTKKATSAVIFSYPRVLIEVLQNRSNWRFPKIYRKTPELESLFN